MDKDTLNDIRWELVTLDTQGLPPKRAKRKLQEILRKHELDDDFIENINHDTVDGFEAAIIIMREILVEKCSKLEK